MGFYWSYTPVPPFLYALDVIKWTRTYHLHFCILPIKNWMVGDLGMSLHTHGFIGHQ